MSIRSDSEFENVCLSHFHWDAFELLPILAIEIITVGPVIAPTFHDRTVHSL